MKTIMVLVLILITPALHAQDNVVHKWADSVTCYGFAGRATGPQISLGGLDGYDFKVVPIGQPTASTQGLPPYMIARNETVRRANGFPGDHLLADLDQYKVIVSASVNSPDEIMVKVFSVNPQDGYSGDPGRLAVAVGSNHVAFGFNSDGLDIMINCSVTSFWKSENRRRCTEQPVLLKEYCHALKAHSEKNFPL